MAESSSVLLFDTQRAVEELVAAGMPPERAGVVVRLQARWADRNFATGEDIERLRAEMSHLREGLVQKIDTRFAAIEQTLDAQRGALETKIAESAGNTVKWVAGLQVGTAAVYLAALLGALKL